ncbi:MAG: hypothetical protein H6541_07455 [Lentimicrobiaceae bacterium]|nr:hypothetical protein [Lentimicrobiaceae bacterium]
MKTYIYIFFLIVLFSCDNKDKTLTENVDFFSNETSQYHGTRKIMDLNVKFSECGEWGGHEENIFITTMSDEMFYIHYQKYCVDCDNMVLIQDSIGSYYTPFKKMVDSCTVVMNEIHKNSIYRFSHKLLSAKFREEFPGHAGNNFYLKKYKGFSGDDFIISFYGFDSELVNDYYELIKELNLPISNIEKDIEGCDN